MKRYFNTGDSVTDHNLSRLDHLITATFERGDASNIHDWLVAVIQTIELLPAKLAAMMDSHYYKIGDAHYHWAATDRLERWNRLAKHLEDDLAMLAEAVGHDDKPATETIDSSGRPTTLGERVETLCAKLSEEGIDTTSGNRVLQEIAMNRHASLSSDLYELQRLANLKRKPYDYYVKVARHINHMRLVAGELYHCK